MQNLNSIQKLSNVSNKTTAVAYALNIAVEILRQRHAGNKIIIQNIDGEIIIEQELMIIWFLIKPKNQ